MRAYATEARQLVECESSDGITVGRIGVPGMWSRYLTRMGLSDSIPSPSETAASSSLGEAYFSR